MNEYTPNLADKQTKARVVRAINWAKLSLSVKHGLPVHSSTIQKNLGNRNNPLGKFLFENLLVLDNHLYTVGKKSMTYKLNKAGYEMIEELVFGKQNTTYMQTGQARAESLKFTAEELFPELATLDFTYSDKSNRLWHPLQNMSSDVKATFWAEYLPFDYDIEAAAPTLLLQMARQNGVNELLVQPIQSYPDNKDAVRKHVAEISGLEIKEAKRLITSLFNGAKLQANCFCSAFETIQCDVEIMKLLQEDEQLKSLRAAIKQMWVAIGKTAKVKDSKQKWAVYYKMERAVLDATKFFLDEKEIKYFTEHDGFRSSREVNLDELTAYIFSRTSLQVKFSAENKEKKESSTNQPDDGTLCGTLETREKIVFKKTRKSFKVELFTAPQPSRIKILLNKRRYNNTLRN